MVFSTDNLAVIVRVALKKRWIGTRIAKEFRNKKWDYRSTNQVLSKYHFNQIHK